MSPCFTQSEFSLASFLSPRCFVRILIVLAGLWSCGLPALAVMQSSVTAKTEHETRVEPEQNLLSGPANPQEQATGSLEGTIVDVTGTAVAAAQVRLTFDDQSPSRETISDDDGKFSFTAVPTGAFHLTITAAGFATRVNDGTIHAGEVQTVPQIQLALA